MKTSDAPQRYPQLIVNIFQCYRQNFWLFWGIMAPVVVVVLVLYIQITLWLTKSAFDDIKERPDTDPYKITSSVGTDIGVGLTILLPKRDTSADPSEQELVNPIFPPGEYEWFLLPFPIFITTNNDGVTWKWRVRFSKPAYGYRDPFSLLLLTFCPLSLVIAHLFRRSHVPTARDAWRQTGRKAFTVLGAFLVCILVLNVITVASDYVMRRAIHLMSAWLGANFKLKFALFSIPYYCLFIVPKFYFLVTMSLYNSCLILENGSLIAVFRRSHTLVSGARWRFFRIYLLTAWSLSVLSSVLLGIALLIFSVLIPDLAAVRGALSPIKFLTLFIGADIEAVLPRALSVSTTVAIHIVRGVITAFLVPIWAILTTHLYLERAEELE